MFIEFTFWWFSVIPFIGSLMHLIFHQNVRSFSVTHSFSPIFHPRMPMPPMPLDSNNTTSRRRPVALVSFVVPCQFPRSGDAWMFGTSDGWDQDHRIAAWEVFNVRRTCSCQTFQDVTVTCWLYINRNGHSDTIVSVSCHFWFLGFSSKDSQLPWRQFGHSSCFTAALAKVIWKSLDAPSVSRAKHCAAWRVKTIRKLVPRLCKKKNMHNSGG